MALLELDGVKKAYGDVDVLSGVDLEVDSGTFTVVCSMPAAGKSVLARIVCGLEPVDAGRVFLRGEDITTVGPGGRNIGYVPQSFALYPHYSVERNIAYPLQLDKLPAAEIGPRVRAIAEMLGVADLLGSRVDQISGGQKQRVALARGLVKQTSVFVLDDPLVGLDFKLREQLVDDLRGMQRQLGATFVYLTSQPLETMTLGEVVSVLHDGRVVETGRMPGVYLRPGHVATMQLLGFPRANVIEATVEGGSARSELLSVDVTGLPAGTTSVLLGIRPENLELFDPVPGAIRIPLRLQIVEDLGSDSVIHLEAGSRTLTACVPTHALGDPDTLELEAGWVRPESVQVFDATSGRALGVGQSVAHV